MSQSTSFDKLDQMLQEGAISEDDYHQLWNALRGESTPGKKSAAEVVSERKLTKNSQLGKICGVCAGLGAYFKVDPNVFRFILLITIPFLGLVTGILYLIFALLLPWDGPEEMKAFRVRGHAGWFMTGAFMEMLVLPALFSVLLLPKLIEVYTQAGYEVWSSRFQATFSGRAIDSLSEYGYWVGANPMHWMIGGAIIAASTLVLYGVYYNLCNARFRQFFVWTVFVSGAAWLVFMVAGSLYPLFTLVAPV
ncbi:MAG: PspC domain-containing protein [Candidatus Hydrogenedentes bacterium]|nr:PspC domain-containing protein [Candidatus Hydrogenedentota bacterium]